MASGKKAYVGAVACPRDWKLGTIIRIDEVEYICEDRYNKNLEDRIDIFFGYGQEAHERALQYGKKLLTVDKVL